MLSIDSFGTSQTVKW